MREPFHKAQVYITTLLVIEIILGALIILTTAVYHHILGTYLADTERRMLNGQLFNTYLLGFQLIATYLASIFMWNSLWVRRSSPNICLLLSVWMFFTFLILLCACATMWTLYWCAEALHITAESSLLKGIDLYYSCPEWKLLWDGLQFYRECCGVHNYLDWMKASWMPNDGIANESTQEPCGEISRKNSALAPYACCKHSCNSCYENYIPRYGSTAIPFLNLSQINTDGCLPQFESSLWDAIHLLMFFVASTILIDIIMCCVTRFVINYQNCDRCACDDFDDDDDENTPMLILNKEVGEDRRDKRIKIDRRTMMNSKHNSATLNRGMTAKDFVDCELENRAYLEANRRAAIRSNLDAEVERRAAIRAQMEEELRSKLNTQRKPSPGGRPLDGNGRDFPPDRREEGGFSCSGCTKSRNFDSGESRFVH